MLILRQLRVPLFQLIQSLASVKALQKILAVFFSINSILLRSLWLNAIGSMQNVRVFFISTSVHVVGHDSCKLLKYNEKQKKCKLKLITNCIFCKFFL